jgi:predicted nucleic acid-binding protein
MRGLRENLTPYDAAYVALAEGLGAPLPTRDGRIGGAPATQCLVELLS